MPVSSSIQLCVSHGLGRTRRGLGESMGLSVAPAITPGVTLVELL